MAFCVAFSDCRAVMAERFVLIEDMCFFLEGSEYFRECRTLTDPAEWLHASR
jgi:hypothetical protein